MSAKEADIIKDFLDRHPEIESATAQSNFQAHKSTENEIPYGVIAIVDNKTKLSTSVLPTKQFATVSLYALTDTFSELQHLGQGLKLNEKTKEFLQQTGLGPTESDIALASRDFLPKHRGLDQREWRPYLGEHGFVSVLSSESSVNFDKAYYLQVSVPHLPFATEALQSLSMNSASDITQHDDWHIVRQTAQRNADKIAQLFANTFKIELRHRRPDTHSKNGTQIAKPIATTMNLTIVPENAHKMRLQSGIGTAIVVNPDQIHLLPVSPRLGVVVTERRIKNIPLVAPNMKAKPRSVQDVGQAFLKERTFWKNRDKNAMPTILAQDNVPASQLKELAEQHNGTVLTPVLLIAHE